MSRHPMIPGHDYDDIAPSYDALFDSPEAEAENLRVVKEIGYNGGHLLDIGCGTGLLLRYLNPDYYLGIDPSPGMIWELKKRHGPRLVAQTTFEKFSSKVKYDRIVALFGTASYINPDDLLRVPEMLTTGGRYYLMFYAEHYTPVTHIKTGVFPRIHRRFPDLPAKPYTIFDNYVVYRGTCA